MTVNEQLAYACGDDQVVHDGRGVFSSRESMQIGMGWRDDEGDHFVEWPRRTTTMEALEYVIPADGSARAIARVYDTSKGGSRVDWRLKHKTLCTATGNDVAFDDAGRAGSVRTSIGARTAIEHALVNSEKRYTAER